MIVQTRRVAGTPPDMSEADGPGRCNRCGEPLEPDTPVSRAFSGRWPYEHARPEDCSALDSDSAQSQRAPDAAE